MNEKDLINRTLIDQPDNVRLFRNNVGKAWTGEILSDRVINGRRVITIASPRMFHGGLVVGSSDLIGWTSIEITPEMVGSRVAVFTAIELKTGRVKTTDAQQNFIDQVSLAGGIGKIVRE